jgi:hypothetical protein
MRIAELNPLDENARAAAGQISEGADKEALAKIDLPKVTRRSVSPQPVPEVKAEETKAEPEPFLAEQQAKEEIVVPEKPIVAPSQPQLSEEEAHLGPVIEDEVEPVLEPEIEPEPPEEVITKVEPAEPKPEPQLEKPAPSVSGGTTSALSEMFSKLKSKPLIEVQKEDWNLPVVDSKKTEQSNAPDIAALKPDIRFTVPLRDSIDPKKKMDLIHKEIGLKPDLGAAPEEKKKTSTKIENALATEAKGTVSEKTAPSTDKKPPANTSTTVKKTTAARKKSSRKKSADTISFNSRESTSGKIELKIPVPTFTLVEVFKKQKLYNEALQLLDVLEKRSKNKDKIEKERQELLRLKMEGAGS